MIASTRFATPLVAAASLALPATGSAQTAAPATPPPSAGVFNDWLRNQNPAWRPWDFGMDARIRWEDKSYGAVPGAGPTAVDFRANTPVAWNSYVLYRVRVHTGWSPCDWFMVYGQGQGSYSTSDARQPDPQADGPFNFFQGYVVLGNPRALPVTLKVGRQTLSYGDERQVGAADWDNLGRSFDAVKARWEGGFGWVDVFTGRPVLADPDGFNESNPDNYLSGVYGSTRKLVPQFEAQLYFLANNASAESPRESTSIARGISPRDIYTVGTRWRSLPDKLGPWDAGAEIAGQFGSFQYPAPSPGVVSGQRLSHLAWAANVEVGYTFDEPTLKPRLGAGFNYGSGDDDPDDDQHGTYSNLFPTNHRFYGYLDFWSWQNMLNPYASLTVRPAKGLSIQLSYHAYWLATTEDFFYQVNGMQRATGGYGLQPGNGSFAGQEINLVATYAVKRFLRLEAGYGHYFTGAYINQTMAPVGGARDSNWFYAQARLTL